MGAAVLSPAELQALVGDPSAESEINAEVERILAERGGAPIPASTWLD